MRHTLVASGDQKVVINNRFIVADHCQFECIDDFDFAPVLCAKEGTQHYSRLEPTSGWVEDGNTERIWTVSLQL